MNATIQNIHEKWHCRTVQPCQIDLLFEGAARCVETLQLIDLQPGETQQ